MLALIEKIMKAVKRYNTIDFAILKTCLVAIGILMGLNWRKFFKRHIHVVWGVAIVSYLWTFGRLFCNLKKEFASEDADALEEAYDLEIENDLETE